MSREWPWSKKIDGYFIGFCRRAFRWSPAYKDARAKALVRIGGKGEYYRCAKCSVGANFQKLFGRKETHVDHVSPVVDPKVGWTGSWDTYRDRMGLNSSKPVELQILCKECHTAKSIKENAARRLKKKGGSVDE